MEDFGRFLARHPGLVGAFFAAGAALAAWNAFRGGIAYARLRALTAEAANEALGG